MEFNAQPAGVSSLLVPRRSQRLDSGSGWQAPLPTEPSPWLLLLNSYAPEEHSTTEHECTTLRCSYWLHFQYIAILHSFGTHRKHCFKPLQYDVWEGTLSSSEVHTMAAGQILLNKVGCQPISLHPHPTLPFKQGYKSALCGHGESCMFHLQMGWGAGKSLVHAQWAGKAHPVFPLLYNNHFYKPEIKDAWERGTHQLTFIAKKNMTSQPKPKGPHYPCKSSVPLCTHEKNSS